MPEADALPPAAGSGYRLYIDFDNTISRGDVLDGIIEHFAADLSWRQLESEWEAGRISARTCLDGQLRALRGTWPEFQRYLAGVELDPGYPALCALLRSARIEGAILSDNFDLFLGEILRNRGQAELPVFANHAELEGDRVRPGFPFSNPDCPGCAHCKKTHFVPRRDRRRIIYIGDGRSDICPATHADIVFAKTGLLAHLQAHGQSCHPFTDLQDVTDQLRHILP